MRPFLCVVLVLVTVFCLCGSASAGCPNSASLSYNRAFFASSGNYVPSNAAFFGVRNFGAFSAPDVIAIERRGLFGNRILIESNRFGLGFDHFGGGRVNSFGFIVP